MASTSHALVMLALASAAAAATPAAVAAAGDPRPFRRDAGGGAGRGSSSHAGLALSGDSNVLDGAAGGVVSAFEAAVLPRGVRDDWFSGRFSNPNVIPESSTSDDDGGDDDGPGGFDMGDAAEEDMDGPDDMDEDEAAEDGMGDTGDEVGTGNPVSMTEPPAAPAGDGEAGAGSGGCGDPMVKEMVGYDNKARSSLGVAELKCDALAGRLAFEWSQGQCRVGSMSHAGYSNRCAEAKEAGWHACGENVAYNWPPQLDTTTANTHSRWMDSQGHRENILEESFDVVGYGWHVCGADDRVYWTGFFGKTDGGSDDGVAGVSLDRSQPQPEPTPSPPSGGAGSGGGACGDPMVKEMVAYDNKARAENGRAALECDNMLAGIALRWSKGQCADKRISHDGMNGRCEEIYDQGFNACAENVAYNWPPKLDTTTYDTHVDWMNSPGHRKNILKEDLTHVGYGWYVCAALPGEQDRVYWTGFFGRK